MSQALSFEVFHSLPHLGKKELDSLIVFVYCLQPYCQQYTAQRLINASLLITCFLNSSVTLSSRSNWWGLLEAFG
jgi:hypothetical protein